MRRALPLTFVLGTLLVASLGAQDSVSKLQGLPGDALDAHAPSEQRNDYVVDLSAVRSSWGHAWALGPIVKASAQRRQSPEFFSALLSAQAMSRDELVGVPYASASYGLWSAAGRGVNGDPTKNDPPQSSIDTSAAVGTRFAVACAEFATGDVSTSLSQILGALVDRDPARPSRLFVSRIVAAVNSPDDACNLAEVGLGAVDADGALYLRCDDGLGSVADCGSLAAVVGNNYVRVRLPARTPNALNLLLAGAGSDGPATDYLLISANDVHNPPSAIPASVAGRPLAIGSNFLTQFVHEANAGALASTSAHKDAAALDHRGNVSWSPHDFPALLGPSTHGTAAMLGVAPNQASNLLLLWGLDASGAPTGTRALAMPTPLTVPNHFVDNDDGARSDMLGPGFVVFDHYHSQVAFRGGNGQVAVGRDPLGNLLAAAVAHIPNVGSPQTDDNLIAVARVDAQGALRWTMAAWVANDVIVGGGGATLDAGKTLYDSAGNAIGRLKATGHLSTGAGPSFSAPMMDAAGNVWFLSTLEVGGQTTVGLVRAVLDPVRFAYRLELVFRQGEVVRGRNSQRDYQIAFLDVWDVNSVSSGTAFSGNITAGAWNGADPAALPVGDPRALGGLVLKATIVYDVDQDGQFVRSTGTGGTPSSPDEDYQVLLYLQPSADCDEDGIPDDAEIAEGEADLDGNGLPDSCQAGVGFCPGDGSAGACPGVGSIAGCANGASGHGCANSGDPAGALLEAHGDAAQGSLTLLLRNLPTGGRPTVFLMRGTQQGAPVAFGDGLRCVQPSGASLFVGVAANGLLRIPLQHPGSAGTTLYQTFYRSTPGFCTPAAFNVSSGVAIAWP